MFMFNEPAHVQTAAPRPVTVYFLDWMKTEVLTPETRRRALKQFDRLAAVASPVARLKMTPQTPPYHAEGEMVADHVMRVLAGLDAFSRGVSLANVEEFIREKDFLLELHALEGTLQTQAAFLAAYAVCHDVAKADGVVFEAQPGSAGEVQGFAVRAPKIASEPEKVRYDKLRRAHAAKNSQTSFFDAYGITVHYRDHSRLGASDEYASTREAVLAELEVPLSHAKVFAELIRAHMDVIHGFAQGPDPVKYRALAAIAERAGVHVPVFLDFLPATVFLDAVLGSLLYVKGEYKVDFQILFNLFRSEREAMPERHQARAEALRRGRKLEAQQALEAANIDAEAVFELLETPYGPVRGQVMAKIHQLIRDPHGTVDFGEHTAELRRRAQVAHKLLAAEHLTLD